MAEKNKQKELSILSDTSKPTLFIDNLFVNSRSDGMLLVRFVTALPESLKEEARMVISAENMKKMLNVLCNHLKYFPPQADQSEKKEENNSPSQAGAALKEPAP